MMFSAQVIEAIGILLIVIERQDWTPFRSVALSNPAYIQAIARAIANCPEFNGMTLHDVTLHWTLLPR